MREKLAALPESERQVRAQEFKGKYEEAMANVQNVADTMAEKYVTGQATHFRNIIKFLDRIIDA